jgi:hypothetical protein
MYVTREEVITGNRGVKVERHSILFTCICKTPVDNYKRL